MKLLKNSNKWNKIDYETDNFKYSATKICLQIISGKRRISSKTSKFPTQINR